MRADPESPRGWQSPYYYDRIPALSLEKTAEASNATFWTLSGPGFKAIEMTDSGCIIELEQGITTIQFQNPSPVNSILVSAVHTGSFEDHITASS